MPSRRQLVCQHLERISRALLERHQDLVRSYVRGRHGIYALYRGDRLYYLGLASNLRSRLKHHLGDRHMAAWDRFSVYLTIEAGHMKEMESLFLRIDRPKGNRNRGRLKWSENLELSLLKDFKLHQRGEKEELFGRRNRHDSEHSEKAGRLRSTPPLARYSSGPKKLRARYKGRTYRARLRRDGQVRFDGQVFRTPSGAARAILKRNCDGWRFWKVERAPGDWVRLEDLRRSAA